MSEARAKGSYPAEPPVHIDHDLTGGRFPDYGKRSVSTGRVTITGVDFSGLRFEHFIPGPTRFVDCDFSRTRYTWAGGFGYHPGVVYVRCRFDRADLRVMKFLGAARFEQCSFRGTKIIGWDGDCAEFIECVFEGKIERCDFSGRPHDCIRPVARRTNEFRGNDFSKADIIDTRFCYGIDIDAQVWPTSPGYLRIDRWMERVRYAQATVSRWPPSPERERAERKLEIYSMPRYHDQTVLLVLPTDFRMPADERERLIALLREA